MEKYQSLKQFIEKKADDIGTISITDSISEDYLEQICEEYFKLKTELTKSPNTEKPFIVATLRRLEKDVSTGESSYSFVVQELNRIAKEFYQPETDANQLKYTTQDIIDAVQYGFEYRADVQNNGVFVPTGNVLQWIMFKKDLLEIPEEFIKIKNNLKNK